MNKKLSKLKSYLIYALILFGLYPLMEFLLVPNKGVFLLSIKYPLAVSLVTIYCLIVFTNSNFLKGKKSRIVLSVAMLLSIVITLSNLTPFCFLIEKNYHNYQSPIDGKKILILEQSAFNSEWTVYSKEYFMFYVPIGKFESETAPNFTSFVEEIDWAENQIILTYPDYTKIVTDIFDYAEHTKTRLHEKSYQK